MAHPLPFQGPSLDGIEFREAVPSDCAPIGAALREADTRELEASLGFAGEEAVLFSLAHSDCSYTVADQDGPFMIFGLVDSDQEGVGIVWLLSTDKINDYPRTFLKFSLKWVDWCNERYPVLTNIVDLRNTLHIRWLRWLGCEFPAQHKVGPDETLFVQFVRTPK